MYIRLNKESEGYLVEEEEFALFVIILTAGPKDLREYLARANLLEFVVTKDDVRCWVVEYLPEDHSADL